VQFANYSTPAHQDSSDIFPAVINGFETELPNPPPYSIYSEVAAVPGEHVGGL
jgi:hypothetical protein